MTAEELREEVRIAINRSGYVNRSDEKGADAAIRVCMKAAAEFSQIAKEIAMERPQSHTSKKNFCITMDNLSKALLSLIPETAK